jgi:hypothetical protein
LDIEVMQVLAPWHHFIDAIWCERFEPKRAGEFSGAVDTRIAATMTSFTRVRREPSKPLSLSKLEIVVMQVLAPWHHFIDAICHWDD